MKPMLIHNARVFCGVDEEVIDEVKIDSLKYLETWTLATSYEPSKVGETSIIVGAITSDGTIYEDELDAKIKIVATESSESEKIKRNKTSRLYHHYIIIRCKN